MDKTRRISRRDLIRYSGVGAMAAVGLAVMDPADAGAAASTKQVHIPQPQQRDLRQGSFESLVGSKFDIQTDQGRQRVTLTAVKQHSPPHLGQGECFSLLFSVPKRNVAESGTYPMSHPQLGTFGMFVTAVGPPGKNQRYEAVVNRL